MSRISSAPGKPPRFTPQPRLAGLPVVVLVNMVLLAGCGGGSGGGSSSAQTAAAGGASPPGINLTADPQVVESGETAWISWTTTNADSCTASGAWSGAQPTSGSFRAGPLSVSSSFVLSCSGPGGGSLAQVGVGVAGDDVPTAQISASPPGVASGGASTLLWTSTNATACEASGAWAGNRPLTGSESTGPVSVDTSYWLSCSGPSGNALALTTVMIRVAELSWDAPTQNVDGTPLTDLAGFVLYWGKASRQYSSSVPLDGDRLSYRIELAPGNYFFSMTATDADGNESAFSNEVSKLII